MKNTIKITGSIDTEAFNLFFEELMAAGKKPIELVINSEGGTASDALAITALMDCYPARITTFGVGIVQSAATIILAAGAKGFRKMDRYCWLMVHTGLSDIEDSPVSEFERRIAILRQQEDMWDQKLAKYLNLPVEEVQKLHSFGEERRKYFNAEQSLNLGFVDKVTGG